MAIEAKQVIVVGQLVSFLQTEGVKTPIVLLHGWRSEGNVWVKVIEVLTTEGYPCYALDLPGFGGSELPKRTFSVQDYVTLVLELLQKLNIPKAIIIGHSFGGRIGIKLGSLHPEKIEKLILVDSGGIRDKSLALTAKKVVAKIVGPVFKLPGLVPLRAKLYKHMGAEDYVKTPELNKTFVQIVSEDLQKDLLKIQTPTLIVWGGRDTDTPMHHGRLMHQLIRNSKFALFSSAGHYSFLDEPDAFNRCLLTFLSL